MNQVAPTGQRFGGYLLGQEVARGGQGAVYEAHDSLGRLCALKLLKNADPTSLKRFAQEGRVLAALSHPNLLRVTDLGTERGVAFLAMEFVEGQDLEARVSAQGLPDFAWSAKVLCAVAHALHYCHGRGLVHRDVKPANVVIEAGSERPVLVDFGMVHRDPERMRLSSLDGAALSKTGEVRGTPKYMAPEQASKKRFGAVSPRTDVYALGACLYFLLTGRPPVEGSTVINVMANLLRGHPKDPRALNPEVPPGLAAFCLRALSKQQEARPGSAEAFAVELARLTGQEAWLPEFPKRSAAPAPEGAPLGPSDPRSLGPYRILGSLGRGGMGAVFCGRHDVLGAVRAVKVVLGIEEPRRRERFRREIAHLSRVRHPNVVAIHESGEVGGWAWYAMDLVGGRSLEALLEEQGALPWRRACAIALGVAQGLGALHALGVVHRDVKPGNVVLREDGRPVVLDLGLAVAPELDQRLTKTGAVVGTPYYLAPEQVAGGKSVDARADVYATGLLLYELLTGERAVGAESIHLVLAEVLHQEIPPPSALVPTLPAVVDRVCARALVKEPSRRLSDGAALAQALREVCERGGDARRASPFSRLLALCAVLASVGIVGWAQTRALDPSEVARASASSVELSPEPASSAPRPPPLTPRQQRDGERAFPKVKRLEDPRERAEAATRWLEEYTSRHTLAGAMQALKQEAEHQFPVRRIKGARYVAFGSGERFVTWTHLGRKDTLRLWDTRRPDEQGSSKLPWKISSWCTLGDRLFFAGRPPLKVLTFSAEDLRRRSEMRIAQIPARIAVSPDGRVLAVASRIGNPTRVQNPYLVFFLDSSDGSLLRRAPLGVMARVMGLAYSPDGTRLVAIGGTLFDEKNRNKLTGTNAVYVLDARDGALLLRDQLRGRPSALALRGEVFVVGTIQGEVLEYRVAPPARRRRFSAPETDTSVRFAVVSSAMDMGIRGVAISLDGERVFTAGGEPDLNAGALAEWSVKTGERLRLVEGLECVTGLALSPDGEYLAVPYLKDGVELWRAR